MNTAEKTAPRQELMVAASDFGLTQREIELVRSHIRTLETRIGPVTDAYYDHLLGTEYGHLLKPDRLERLKAARTTHWRLLLEADLRALQDDYLKHFGPHMRRSGFSPEIFVVAAGWFVVEFGRFVDRSVDIPKTLKNELRTALVKLAFFDLALAQASCAVIYLD